LKENERRPAIVVEKDYGQLPAISCFPGQLNQVFMNFLANAIDALEESNQGRKFEEISGHPNHILIQTRLSEPGDQVVIRIQDNGIGMSEEVQRKLFEQVFTTKPVGVGTGLGLSITRQIVVDKHGGSLNVNSVLGQGSEFIITLPIQADCSIHTQLDSEQATKHPQEVVR
jgi:signal transduction histidine kinase